MFLQINLNFKITLDFILGILLYSFFYPYTLIIKKED